MTSLSNNAEGGSNGTTVTTGNSGGGSGTAWDVCNVGTNATNAFDTGVAMHGVSYKIATGGTSATAYNRWTSAITALWASGLTTHYGRFYINFQTIPGATRVIVGFDDTTVASTRASIACLSTGALRLRNSSNGTVATFTTTLSTNTWYRVEYRIDGSTSGAYDFRLYVGDNATATETITGGTANFGGAIGAASYGYTSAVASLPQINFDDVQVNDTGLPGPASSATTYTGTAALSATGTLTASGVPIAAGSASLASTGTATAAGTPIASSTAALSGTGNLAASGKVEATGAASLTATGTATAAGNAEHPGVANLTATSALTVTGVAEGTGTGALSATGAAAATGQVDAVGSAQFSGSATASATGQAIASGSATLSATGTATGTGTAIRPSIATLVDTFAALDTAKWTQVNNPGVTGAVNAGRYEFTISNNAGTSSRLESVRQYRLNDSRIVVRLADAGNQSVASLEVYPVTVEADANNKLFWVVSGNFIGAYSIVGGSQTGLAFAAYNPAVHIWFRISETSGTVSFATSADGSTWTELTSTATPIDVSSVQVILRAGEYNSEPSGATVVALDDVNNIFVSGTAVLSANSSGTAAGVVVAGGTAAMSGTATAQASGAAEAQGAASAAGAATLSASGIGEAAGAADLAAMGTLSAITALVALGVAGMSATGSFTSGGVLVAAGSAHLSATGTAAADGTADAPVIAVPATHLHAYSVRPRLVASGNDP